MFLFIMQKLRKIESNYVKTKRNTMRHPTSQLACLLTNINTMQDEKRLGAQCQTESE